jgi:hypothetical protein
MFKFMLLGNVEMSSYLEIILLLDSTIGADDIGAHGAFWRTLSRDQFVVYQVFGHVPLLARDTSGKFDPDESNLVKALEGRLPFGRDIGIVGARYPRMPAKRPAMPKSDITTIRNWILAGCPE